MEYNFKNKRYATYSDETSGVGGKYRPTTHGVYDNKMGRCIYVHGFDGKTTFEQAKEKAIELNKIEASVSKTTTLC